MAKDKNKQNQGKAAQNGVTTHTHISAREEGKHRTKIDEFTDIIIDLLGGVAAAGTILLCKAGVESFQERRARKKAAMADAGSPAGRQAVEAEVIEEDEWSYPDDTDEDLVKRCIGYAIEELEAEGPKDFKDVRNMMLDKNPWVDGLPNLNGLISSALKGQAKKIAAALSGSGSDND